MDAYRLKRALKRGATFIDRNLAAVGLRFERPALVAFLFHAVFDSKKEVDRGLIHPQEGMTRDAFEQFVDYFLSAGYAFVSLADVERGLPEQGYYVCLTFDDGYANNLRIIDLLRGYDVPAAVFVATGYVDRGHRYWWDALYSERLRRGSSERLIEYEIAALKRHPPEEIEHYLEQHFGAGTMRARSDLDRPLTRGELRALSEVDLITIGNHTVDHAILTVLSPDRVREQLGGAQRFLEEATGRPVSSVSYPNGNYDAAVLRIASEVGLSSGITTERRKEPVPIPADRLLTLGRYQLERGADLGLQLRAVRSGLQVANTARRLRDRAPTA